MKNLLMYCLVFATLGLVSCEAPVAEDHAEEAIDMTALRAEIQAMEDAFAKAEMAKDAEAVVAYYADDAVSLGPNKPPLVGKPAILANIKANMATDSVTVDQKYTLVDLWAQGNLAVEVGEGVATREDGSKRTGKYLSVFENRDGKWVCIRDSYNNNAPDTE
jgi:uncharacterized protein (TIGR02246 family)